MTGPTEHGLHLLECFIADCCDSYQELVITTECDVDAAFDVIAWTMDRQYDCEATFVKECDKMGHLPTCDDVARIGGAFTQRIRAQTVALHKASRWWAAPLDPTSAEAVDLAKAMAAYAGLVHSVPKWDAHAPHAYTRKLAMLKQTYHKALIEANRVALARQYLADAATDTRTVTFAN